MQIVIEISNDEYTKIKNGEDIEIPLGGMLIARDRRMSEIIRAGIVLPEDHGRLIDADKLLDLQSHSFRLPDNYSDRRGYRIRDKESLSDIVNSPTILKPVRRKKND